MACKKFIAIVLVVYFFITDGTPLTRYCSECELEYCVRNATDCPQGVRQDPCGCCEQGLCILEEGARCLNPSLDIKISNTDLGRYGICGEQLECLQRNDLNHEKVESVCSCTVPGEVCGSNKLIYETMCSFLEAQKHNKSLQLLRKGRCDTTPDIINGPIDIDTIEGHSLALDCEVRGFPVPNVSWEFQALDGSLVTLPGDDSSIVVQTRGGPDNYMITSWVQILSVEGKNAGTYTCVASNSEGITHSMAKATIAKATIHNFLK